MTSSLRFPPPELARILSGLFTLRFPFGVVPNVEPSLDRLQIAGLAEKIKLFHCAPSVLSMVGSVVFFVLFSLTTALNMLEKNP